MRAILTNLFLFITLIFFITIAYRHDKTSKYLNTHHQKQFTNPKLWIHRCNSIEMLKESIYNADGVELDVVFDEKTNEFDVNHPPAKSINLGLDKYFSSIEKPFNTKYWLDFKNLSEANCEASLKRIDFLTDKHHINKDNIIIESPCSQSLLTYQKKGFKVSYYLPLSAYMENENDYKTQLNSIKSFVDINPNIYISTNCLNYRIIKKHFPKTKKLFWISSRAINLSNENALRLLIDIINDKMVDVLLVQSETKTGWR